MAIVFGLAVECGASESTSVTLAQHFAQWPTRLFADRTGAWWCHVVPEGLGASGIGSASEAAAMTQAGYELYDRLRTAPPRFRYALAGVETDEFRTYSELEDERDLDPFAGLVLTNALWEHAGRPSAFVPFSPGYRWMPYRGESFSG